MSFPNDRTLKSFWCKCGTRSPERSSIDDAVDVARGKGWQTVAGKDPTEPRDWVCPTCQKKAS